jgi:DNA repair exonuclease SbcCD ATPase subunit
MKELDLLVQKDVDLKRATDHVTTLLEKIANLNIAIGAKEELIKSKEKEIKRIEDESKKSEKVIVKSYPLIDSSGRTKCPICGKSDYSTETCGYCNTKKVVITYTNLQEVEASMKSEIEKNLKKSLSEAETSKLDLEIQVEELNKKLERKEKTMKNDMEEFEDRTRKRYNKLVDGHTETIEDLTEELAKVKKNKTDEEVERLRKEDFNTLKTTIEKLQKEIDEPKQTGGFFWNLISKFIDTSARKQAIKELREAKELVSKVEYRTEHPEGYRNETMSERKERERKEQLIKQGKITISPKNGGSSHGNECYNPYNHYSVYSQPCCCN